MNEMLQRIMQTKAFEVAQAKAQVPEESFRASQYFTRTTLSLSQFLLDPNRTGIIAEYKRKSPSEGVIHETYSASVVTADYEKLGASACSILTDLSYFGGANHFITDIREDRGIPILRKEFIVDPYQIYQAKALGADAILLIAECLSKADVSHFTQIAQDIGMEVLLELHSDAQLEKIPDHIDVVGVNNRDLDTFEVNINHSIKLFDRLPDDVVKISESGIRSASEIKILREVGYQGFLIGTQFMKAENPGQAFAQFVQTL